MWVPPAFSAVLWHPRNAIIYKHSVKKFLCQNDALFRVSQNSAAIVINQARIICIDQQVHINSRMTVELMESSYSCFHQTVMRLFDKCFWLYMIYRGCTAFTKNDEDGEPSKRLSYHILKSADQSTINSEEPQPSMQTHPERRIKFRKQSERKSQKSEFKF